MKLDGKVMVVTGAGDGMGREITLQLIKRGAKVAMVDISKEGMQKTADLAGSSSLSMHPLSVSDRGAVEALPAAVIEQHGVIDGVINCAGVIQPFVDVKDLNYETIERVMNINFYGTVYITKALLPYLLERPEAHIANISSMGGFLPVPGQTIYGASKAAVKLFTEGLHAELKDTNVNVTVIHPGAVNTNIVKNSGVEERTSDISAEEADSRTLDSGKAAKIMLDAIEKNKYRVMVGKDASFLDKYYRLSPRRAAAFIAKQMGRLKA